MSFFEDASLVLIPSGIKNQKIYSVKPTDGTGDLTFSRASSATRVASNGLIEKVRENLLLYSEQFDNAAWDKGGSPTITPNAETAPDGTLTADTMTITGFIDSVSQTFALGAGTYTVSVWAKVISETTAGQVRYNIVIDGVADTFPFTPTTTWTRYTQTFTAATSVGAVRVVRGYGFEGTLAIWGAQLEVSDFGATDYIATTTAAVSVGPVSGLPRLDYLNSSCPRLLLEPQRTNQLTFSEQINNAAWTNVRGVITANSTISPSGYQDADTFASDAAQPFPPALTRNPTYAGNTNYTLSVFAKVLGNTNVLSLGYVDNLTGFLGGGATFNLATQVITISQSPNASVTASMQDYGNGWYRLTLGFLTIAIPTFNYFQIGQTTNDVANGFALWGAQLEAGAYATSYIPTLSTSVTRVLDAASKTGISSLIGQTEGTLFIDFEINSPDSGASKWIFFLKGSGGVYIGFYTNGANKFIVEVNNGGEQFFNNSVSVVLGKRFKMALAYKQNDFALYVDGVQIAIDNSGTVPTCSSLDYLFNTTASNIGSLEHNQTLLFKTRLTNAQLAELTTL